MEQQQSMRSDIYLLLATLFRQAPTKDLIDFLANLEFEDNGTSMGQAWSELSSASANANVEELEDEYQELFIGIGRGEVVPFASWHLTGSLMEKPLAEIRTHLHQLGLERSEYVKEPEDHIAALLETMAYLCVQPDVLQKSFFNKHVAPWYERLVAQIKDAQHTRYYHAVAKLMDAFLSLEKVSFAEAKVSKRNTHKIEVKNLTE